VKLTVCVDYCVTLDFNVVSLDYFGLVVISPQSRFVLDTDASMCERITKLYIPLAWICPCQVSCDSAVHE